MGRQKSPQAEQKTINELEAENRVLKDIISRLVNHHLSGDLTFRGPAFGTWQRAVSASKGRP